jgi:hypothetical protein
LKKILNYKVANACLEIRLAAMDPECLGNKVQPIRRMLLEAQPPGTSGLPGPVVSKRAKV